MRFSQNKIKHLPKIILVRLVIKLEEEIDIIRKRLGKPSHIEDMFLFDEKIVERCWNELLWDLERKK
jgi:hypothetical protein